MYTVTCFYKIDGPVNKVRYGAVAKQLSEYLVFVVCFVKPQYTCSRFVAAFIVLGQV